MSSDLSGAPQKIWPWPDSPDALLAAPANHLVLFENHHVRVLQTRILRGQIVPVHTHRWPSVLFILALSDFVRRDPLGNATLDTRPSSDAPKHHLRNPLVLQFLDALIGNFPSRWLETSNFRRSGDPLPDGG